VLCLRAFVRWTAARADPAGSPHHKKVTIRNHVEPSFPGITCDF
jgi:hypothetical protein